jgi:uncharacterized Fe-S cluster protein YjdI
MVYFLSYDSWSPSTQSVEGKSYVSTELRFYWSVIQYSFQGPQRQEAGGLLIIDFEYLVFYHTGISTMPLHFSGLWNTVEKECGQVKWCNYWIQNIADIWGVVIRDGMSVWQDMCVWQDMWECDRMYESVIGRVSVWQNTWVCDRMRECVTGHVSVWQDVWECDRMHECVTGHVSVLQDMWECDRMCESLMKTYFILFGFNFSD